ncbi:MAG TPA: hypothetical protein VMR19_02295 [Candidatus Saccharimonadales bacterium]|jgi:hypothetical protein|nr:hypothetical protein [Candidatus Saccharimonadales bacterium]
MLINIGVSIFGILIFLFLFWKRLREDYAANIIFESAAYILIGIGLGFVVSLKFFPAWFFWATLSGALLGLLSVILRFKIKFYETLEAFVIGSLPWLGLIFLEDSVVKSSLSSFLAFLGILIMLFIAYYFDTHYKGFSLYKSGRIGFTGLAMVALIFLVRSLIAIAKVPMLSFVGIREAPISGVLMLLSLVLLFNLGKVKK